MIQQQQQYPIPKIFKPISAWGYIGFSILYAIPVIGWIFLFVNAFAAKNRNVRSHARSYFCGLLLIVILGVVGTVLTLIFGQQVADMLNEISAKLGMDLVFSPWKF